MAIAGSTRMQATTIELLIVGAALEAALMDYLGEVDEDSMFRDGLQCRDPLDYARRFEDLLGQIDSEAMASRLAAWIEVERDLYRAQGLVTYLADEYLLDVLTDTTERSPTFMIPPFRSSDDKLSPRSWAFVKNPRYATEETWSQMLQRPPRGLTWKQADYLRIGAPDKLTSNPPRLDNERIHRFAIGNEADPSRTDAFDSALIGIAAGPNDRQWIDWMSEPVYQSWRRRIVIDLGGKDQPTDDSSIWRLGFDVPSGGLELWRHLAMKLALNTVSTITMAALGRIEGNAMTWVSPSNKKLIDRGTRLIAGQTGCDYESACYALFEAIEEVAERQGRHEEAPSPVALAIERIHKNNKPSGGKRHGKRA
jgi:N-acetylmuramic acid 6-phosphate etherase